VKRAILKRPRAKRDLIAHFAYLVEHASLEEARRFLRTVDAALELLAGMPEMGARWDSALPQFRGVRRWIPRGYRNYLLLYRPLKQGIELLHVYHTKRNIRALLDEEES